MAKEKAKCVSTKNSNRRLYLISNMYPSQQNIRYGIFVRKFEDAVKDRFCVKKLVLSKKDRFFSKIWGYIALYLRIIPVCFTASKGDIIYVHFPLYFSPLLLPLSWSGAILVINFHGSDAIFNNALRKLLAVFLRYGIKKSQKVVVPSYYYKKKIATIFKFSEKNIFVYPSGGIDSQIFYPSEEPPKSMTMGFVSNFLPAKGWREFIEALKALKTANELIGGDVYIIGDGPDKEKILQAIEKHQLDVKVYDSVSHEQLAEFYRKFKVLVFPTHKESLGLVGLEAMMCGVPVIASNVGGPMSYIVDGRNGFIFEKGNSKAISRKILKVKNMDEKTYQSMRQNALKSARRYEKGKVNDELLNMLTELP